MLWYQCNCGNKCLTKHPPESDICGGCDAPNWRLMKKQQSYKKGESDWIHPNGEV